MLVTNALATKTADPSTIRSVITSGTIKKLDAREWRSYPDGLSFKIGKRHHRVVVKRTLDNVYMAELVEFTAHGDPVSVDHSETALAALDDVVLRFGALV